MDRECAVTGCETPAAAKRYCWKHYGRFRRNGDPLASGQHGGSRSPIGPVQNVPDPAPLQAFRLELQAGREAGVPFAAAWRDAIQSVPPPWRDTLRRTRTAWRSGYLRTGSTFPVEALRSEHEPRDIRRSGPPLTFTGARHDGPCELEPLVVPWCC